MRPSIERIDALEVLDSRGYPTLKVTVRLSDGTEGNAYAPSGASTGRSEAPERRDEDIGRYLGKGVTQACATVRGALNLHFSGQDVCLQAAIDGELDTFEGPESIRQLGANVTSAVSMAVARTAANALGIPLYRYLGGPCARRLPTPMMNVINGGKHADNSLEFQEFMIVPHGAPSFSEALRYGAETFHALKALLHERGLGTAVGDEGGFAPNLKDNEQACELILEAIARAGFNPGKDIAIALDPAASSFWHAGHYQVGDNMGGPMMAEALRSLYRRLVDRYPIVSIEDGFAEDDWRAFSDHFAELGDRVQLVGDDLYVTDAALIRRGAAESATNAVLIKINQTGTVTKAVDAIDVCRQNGLAFIISHRSGETEDTFIADFAVAMGGGQIKTGSVSRSERIAKYNRLLEIEHELGDAAVFGGPLKAPKLSKAELR